MKKIVIYMFEICVPNFTLGIFSFGIEKMYAIEKMISHVIVTLMTCYLIFLQIKKEKKK